MESDTPLPPQYPWKEEGPKLQLNATLPTSTAAIQPPTFFDHIRVNRRCVKCRSLIEGFHKKPCSKWRASVRHHDYKDLRASAARGCPVCRFFYHEVALQPHLENLDQNQDNRIELFMKEESISIIDFSSKSKLFEIYHRRDALEEGRAMDYDYSTLRDVQPHPLSDSCWNIAKDWLSTCQSKHEKCSQSESLPLPTRVLDVTGPRPKLVNGSDNSGPYTALSHCWGQGHHPMSHTTTQTLNDFRIGIDIFDLPATFRDAIEVTRRLNIKYLWVDSLCIIQDLIEDWQTEARLMGSYYQNCFLNISALDAPESETGFLVSRQSHPAVHLERNFYMRPARRSWRKVFQDSPLSRRAWVLQERLVSTRVLHYGRDDMFWECLTCSTRESDIAQHNLTDQDTEWLDMDFKRSLQFSEEANVQVVLQKWYQVVEQYTRLSMSHESDMLPAISAIANRIRQATEYKYLAGLWAEDFHQGLLWHADGPRSIPRIWRAPSWSWAQLTGPILQLVSPEFFRVPGEYDLIVLRHLQDDVQIGIDSHSDQTTALHIVGFTAFVWIKGSHGDPPYNNPSLKLIVDTYDERGMPVGMGFLDTLVDGSEIRRCEALAISRWSDNENSGSPWLFFILIEPVSGRPGAYRRIGVGSTMESFHRTFYDYSYIVENKSPRELILL